MVKHQTSSSGWPRSWPSCPLSFQPIQKLLLSPFIYLDMTGLSWVLFTLNFYRLSSAAASTAIYYTTHSRTSIYTMYLYSLSLKLSRVLSIILTNPFKCQVALRFWIFGKANMRMTCIYVPICGGQGVWCCSSVWLYFYLPFLMIRSITCFSNFLRFRKN